MGPPETIRDNPPNPNPRPPGMGPPETIRDNPPNPLIGPTPWVR